MRKEDAKVSKDAMKSNNFNLSHGMILGFNRGPGNNCLLFGFPSNERTPMKIKKPVVT